MTKAHLLMILSAWLVMIVLAVGAKITGHISVAWWMVTAAIWLPLLIVALLVGLTIWLIFNSRTGVE